jgi:hypothetical protein
MNTQIEADSHPVIFLYKLVEGIAQKSYGPVRYFIHNLSVCSDCGCTGGRRYGWNARVWACPLA